MVSHEEYLIGKISRDVKRYKRQLELLTTNNAVEVADKDSRIEELQMLISLGEQKLEKLGVSV